MTHDDEITDIPEDPLVRWFARHTDVVAANLGKHFAFDDATQDVIAIADDYAAVRALASTKGAAGPIVFGVFGSAPRDELGKAMRKILALNQEIAEIRRELDLRNARRSRWSVGFGVFLLVGSAAAFFVGTSSAMAASGALAGFGLCFLASNLSRRKVE